MSGFIAIAALLTVLVVAWISNALLRPNTRTGQSSKQLNTAIYRDQLQGLERDLSTGNVAPEEYEATRDELQLRLLEDTEESYATPRVSEFGFWTRQRTAATLALLIPLGAVSMYWWLGTPSAIDPVASRAVSNEKIVQMVDTLAARLKANPDNPKGWAMLARSYKVMGRLNEAEHAFEKAGDAVSMDADLLVEYADLIATRTDSVEGKPLELVHKALALDPKHPTGLMMSGIAAYRRADFSTAIAQWEKLLTVLEPGSVDAQQVETDIADARAKAGIPAASNIQTAQNAKMRPSTGGDISKQPPVDPISAAPMSQEKINQMVERLAERLKSAPDDLAGWARLARAYKVQGRLAEAEQAYAKAGKLVDSDANLLTQYADLLAIRAGNNLEGRPLALVNKALTLDPKNPMALMMAASAAYRRSDYKLAIIHWENVLKALPVGSTDAEQIRAEINDARSKLGTNPPFKGKK